MQAKRSVKSRSYFAMARKTTQIGYPNLAMADLQALLWYCERRLYDASGTKDDSAESYEDDEAPD